MSEPDVTDLITVQDAIAILDQAPVAPRATRVNLDDAMGLRLAQDVVADRDYPAFEKSLMDGYALRNADAGAPLKIVGEVRAGQSSDRPLSAGETIAIMTGAPLPPGADGVVPIEFTQRDGEMLRITRPADFTRFVALAGSDCRAGSVVLHRGATLGAAQVAVAATIGAHQLDVFARPRVAILATGDEIVPIETNPLPHQIRDSNTIMLHALLTRYGCEVHRLPTVRDEMPALRAAIEAGLKFDALFITGGMSVGAYDLPPKALRELGADILITKLKIKPGKPFIYARLGGCQIFGLPGNPLAGFVCTVRLASRLIQRMAGGEMTDDTIPATLASDLPPNGPREFYQPVILRAGVAHPLAQPLTWKSSADVFTLAQANALLIRPENDPAKSAGRTCTLLPVLL